MQYMYLYRRFETVFQGNTLVFKLFARAAVQAVYRERYDIINLSGGRAPVVSGCNDRDQAGLWIHVEQGTAGYASAVFRSSEASEVTISGPHYLCGRNRKAGFREDIPRRCSVEVLYNTGVRRHQGEKGRTGRHVVFSKDCVNICSVEADETKDTTGWSVTKRLNSTAAHHVYIMKKARNKPLQDLSVKISWMTTDVCRF